MSTKRRDEAFDRKMFNPEGIEASDKGVAEMQSTVQAKELTMNEIAGLFNVPYSLVVDAARHMRDGKRQRERNVKYNVEELRPFLLDRINAQIDNAEGRLERLRAKKRNIEMAGMKAEV